MKRILVVMVAVLLAVGTLLAAAIPALAWDTRWTGGGSIFTVDGVRVTHGFEFHSDVLDKPNRLEVNWLGNRFHLTELLTAESWFNPNFPKPDPPVSPDNYVEATGIGRYNGIDGYLIRFKFSDVGEPGVNDRVEYMVITSPGGAVVLNVGNTTLQYGNHQSHPDNK